MIANFSKGLWMVELHPKSRKLTTMALDIVRFQWTRHPLGSIVAQDVFQWKLDAIFLSVPGVTGIADDMIFFGKNRPGTQWKSPKHFGNVSEEQPYTQPWQDAVQTSKSFLLWPFLEWQRSFSRSRENWSRVENETSSRCGNDEKLPRTDQLPQSVQSKASWAKWSTKGNMQIESGIPAYRSLQDCLSMLQGGNFQEQHSSLLQPQGSNHSTKRCLQERTRSCTTTEFYPSNVCLQSIDWVWEELSEPRERMPSNHLQNGKVPLLPIWKGIYIGDRSEATSINLQETYGGNLSKNSDVSSGKLTIPALPHQVQERCGNFSGRCS